LDLVKTVNHKPFRISFSKYGKTGNFFVVKFGISSSGKNSVVKSSKFLVNLVNIRPVAENAILSYRFQAALWNSG
jgi:hypothetical protein